MQEEDFKNWIQEIKDAATAEEVCDAFGIEREKNNIYCPFPNHNDRHIGNCKLKDSTFYCFRCGKGGNTINLLQLTQNISFIEAGNKIAQKYNVSTYEKIRKRYSSEKKYDPMPITKEELFLLGLEEKSKKIITDFSFSTEKTSTSTTVLGGYITAKETSLVGMQQLWEEDKELFNDIIKGKIREMIPKYITIYKKEIWNMLYYSVPMKNEVILALEEALDTLKVLSENFGYNFIFPNKVQKVHSKLKIR